MRLPDGLRESLRSPMGRLVPDAQVDAASVLAGAGPDPCIITVGDRTTERALELGLAPAVQIVDGTERRRPRGAPPAAPGTLEVRVSNPPAGITDEAADAVRGALESGPPVRITVSGEEDLLVIPACIHAPDGALVLYGQPGEGLVVVRVDAEIRNKAASVLGSME